MAADHVAISATGEVIVTWELFDAVCNPEECLFFNFKLRASKQNAGSGVWVRSSLLLGPDTDSHDAWVTFDAHGRAILVALNEAGAYVSATEGVSSHNWSSFNTVVQLQNPAIVSGLASDNAGNTTMVYEVIGLSQSQGFSVSGTIQANAWSSPVLLSSDTNVSQISFALAANGAGVTAWLSSSPATEVHAAIRSGTTGTWSSAVTVSSNGASEIAPEAAAVNAAGNAMVIYSGYDSADVHTEYATNFTA